MKKVLLKIFSFCMIFCLTFLFVGCHTIGSDPFDGDFEMYGAKVLYRPDSYDFSGNTGGTEEEANNYYAQYAYLIMNNLYQLYAIPDAEIVDDYSEKINSSSDLLPYLYDSNRYQVDRKGVITHQRITNSDGTTTDTALSSPNFLVGVDYNTKWNWSMVYSNTAIDSNKLTAYFGTNENTAYGSTQINQDTRFYNKYETEEDLDITTYYSSNFFEFNKYHNSYVGEGTEKQYNLYSEYTKALEYVIYSYALDLEPKEITVTYTSTAPFYKVTIDTFDEVIDASDSSKNKSSADVALEYIQDLFSKLGSYVGLVSRQITKIQNWIVDNVISDEYHAISDDQITTYSANSSGVGIVEILNAEGNVIGYDFTSAKTEQNTFGRDYAKTVENIVRGVCSDVHIGEIEGGGNVNIDDRFLASEIVEYVGETFNIEDDSNFAKYSDGKLVEGQPEDTIRALEYQSVLIMPSKAQYVENLFVALKYDADLNGTDKVKEDETRYIEIQVELNYYNYSRNLYTTLSSEVVKVYHGDYAVDYIEGNSVYDAVPAGHRSGVVFENIGRMLSNNPDGDKIMLGKFNTNIGNGILLTDIGQDGYTGSPMVTQNPLVLIGSTSLKDWYSIVEPEEENVALTYLTGRLNPEKFHNDPNGCDFLEITYKVMKKPGEVKNYKFFTGLQLIDGTDQDWDNDDDIEDKFENEDNIDNL